MLGFIKRQILKGKQNIIKRRYHSVNVVLHSEMPNPSLSKVVELAGIVDKVNKFEPAIKALSDSYLRAKTL